MVISTSVMLQIPIKKKKKCISCLFGIADLQFNRRIICLFVVVGDHFGVQGAAVKGLKCYL